MVAQIENDAAGWEDDLATLGSEAEPYDPSKIKGNFTHEEFPDHGFALPIAVGMSNDYWGYVPEYREYRSHDHYRKALSGVGPHGADFLATRLSRLAVSMNGGPEPTVRPIDHAYQAESARAEAMATTLGELGAAYEKVYGGSLPADAGPPRIVEQPDEASLFSGAHLSWIGGSTYGAMPEVRVERRIDGGWRPYATTEGDIELTVAMPTAAELPMWRAGAFAWRWTAAFEAFGSDIDLPDASGAVRRSTPAGTYRFVVDGEWRPGLGGTDDYRLTGEPFDVVPWEGITVDDLRRETDGVSFAVGPAPGSQAYPDEGTEHIGPIDVPDSYPSPFRYIDNRRIEKVGKQYYCSFCHFRPWADTSDVERAEITVERRVGLDVVRETVTATHRDGRWFAPVQLELGDVVYVDRGGVVDEFGSINGARSSVLVL